MFRALLFVSALVLTSAVGLWKSTCQADLNGPAAQPSLSSVHARVEHNTSSPRYFVVVYSYQDADNHVLKSHTFATFVKATAPRRVEMRTISWLPAKFADTLKLSFFATAGKNHSLEETLAFARRLGAEVRRWEPVEIDAALYQAALRQAERLAAGKVKYKLYDSKRPVSRGTGVMHCIDAVAEPAGEFRNGTIRGFAAGELVAEHYRSHQVAGEVPTWLTSALPEGATPAEFSEGMLAGK